jgi:hypothetical protein
MSSSYVERLKDPRWQRRRLEILSRADFACEECEARDRTLHVHHKLYRKGAMPWDYADHELAALCEQCHGSWHAQRERLSECVASMPSHVFERLLGYAETLAISGGEGIGERDTLVVRSREHAQGIADASIDWNGGGANILIADCLCDHRVIDQELHDALGLYSDFGIPHPKQSAA